MFLFRIEHLASRNSEAADRCEGVFGDALCPNEVVAGIVACIFDRDKPSSLLQARCYGLLLSTYAHDFVIDMTGKDHTHNSLYKENLVTREN